MADYEKDTTVVTTSNGGTWFLIGVLVVIVGLGAYVYFGGDLDGSEDLNINVDLPAASE